MISIFLAIGLMFFFSPAIPFSASQITTSSEAVGLNFTGLEPSKGTVYYLQVQDQESMAEEEEETSIPYEGFSLVAFGMMAIILLIIVFVVVKVFQRMNKTRKGEM